jgi:glycine/D-amino acid oxidase-like deaminating enzyme
MAQPLWLERPPRTLELPPLDRDLAVDIAVIGGGITGVSVAWKFAQSGLRVALLEAGRLARGSTAASTALLMQESDSDFVELVERYGEPRALRIWHLSRRATRDMIRTLDELEISCGLSECDSVYLAARPAAVRKLRVEFDRRASAGLPGRWLDRSAMQQVTGLEAASGIRTRGNGQADPYRACLGLARAARREGARLFERSAVERIEVGHHDVKVITRHGSVRAGRVVVATGYATPFFKPLATNFRLMNTYVLATRPTTARERKAMGLDQVMLWDNSRPYYYARWTPDRRLLIGGGDRPYVTGRPRLRAFRERVTVVRRHFEKLWPALAEIDYEFAWEGLFATTPDGLPYIGEHPGYPRHLFALGYGGNGMTFGFLAAQLLLDRCGSRPSADLGLFAFDRAKSASKAKRLAAG